MDSNVGLIVCMLAVDANFDACAALLLLVVVSVVIADDAVEVSVGKRGTDTKAGR
jgi:hypothetical protein